MSATATLDASPAVQVDNIPQELRALPQWTFWRFEPDHNGGKDKKVPRNPRTGRNASPTDPATWGTFEAAMDALERFGGDGVQFLLSESDPYTGIDLDHCVDPDTGEVAPWAAQIMACFDAYTEVSPSSTGLRIMIQGKKPEGAPSHCGSIEVYDRARALSITGNVYRAGTVRDQQAQVEWLCLAMKPLAKSLAGPNGEKMSLLFAGRWEEVVDQKGAAYPSQSEADLAFCRYLALAGATVVEIDAAMRLSGLYREDKWSNGYGERTVARAMSEVNQSQEGSRESVALTTLDTSDAGNAEAFIRLYGDRFLYCDALGGWLQYTGTHWTTDRAAADLEAAIEDMLSRRRQHARELIHAAEQKEAEARAEGSSDKEQKAQAVQRLAMKVVNTSKRDTRKINAIKPRVQQRLTVLADEFDQSLDHLNVANGALNLRTGEVEPHSPDQRFTYRLATAYDPDADASV